MIASSRNPQEELAARLRRASLMNASNLIRARATAEHSQRLVASVQRRRAARRRELASRPAAARTPPAASGGHLRRQLATLPVIEQAKGIVMAERRCSDKEAFALLRGVSQHTNTKVSEVAARVVAGRSVPVP